MPSRLSAAPSHCSSLTFAALYLSLSQASTTHFSEPLNHTGAIYLAITVFSTVGFGDITPESDLARIVLSIQMLLDLVVIGAVVRLLTTAAKTGRGDSASPPAPATMTARHPMSTHPDARRPAGLARRAS